MNGGHVKRLLENPKVGQSGEVVDAEGGSDDGLIIDSNQHHEIFHPSHAPTRLAGGFLMLEQV